MKTESIEDGRDLMTLAAGASVPPNSDDTFTYCYNFIEFDWDAEVDGLSVHVRPRVWVNGKKQFDADDALLGGRDPRVTLALPKLSERPEGDCHAHRRGRGR